MRPRTQAFSAKQQVFSLFCRFPLCSSSISLRGGCVVFVVLVLILDVVDLIEEASVLAAAKRSDILIFILLTHTQGQIHWAKKLFRILGMIFLFNSFITNVGSYPASILFFLPPSNSMGTHVSSPWAASAVGLAQARTCTPFPPPFVRSSYHKSDRIRQWWMFYGIIPFAIKITWKNGWIIQFSWYPCLKPLLVGVVHLVNNTSEKVWLVFLFVFHGFPFR